MYRFYLSKSEFELLSFILRNFLKICVPICQIINRDFIKCNLSGEVADLISVIERQGKDIS